MEEIEVLISEEQITERTEQLGRAIAEDYRGKDLILVGVLKGAVVFMVDLARTLKSTRLFELPVELDFLAISSYGPSTESSGVVRILKDLDSSVEGRHVLIVEDIVDTGLTLKYITEIISARNPASLRICALLNKQKTRPSRGRTDVKLDYVGFEIPDRFVVGYGLDLAENYRNLPFIGVLKTIGETGKAQAAN